MLNFPFTDASDTKYRPTVIVIEEFNDFEVLYITSKNNWDWIKISESDFKDWWLSRTSYVKVSKSIPYSKSLFTEENYIGRLSKEKMIEIIWNIVAKYQILLEELREL